MLTRLCGVILALAAFVAALTSRTMAADHAVQRHIVFKIHEEITTRTRVRQETDISQAYNGTGGASSSRSGAGSTASGIQSGSVDGTLAVDIVLVAPDHTLGCDVTFSTATVRRGPTRVWIGPDGAIRWTGRPEDADQSATFLLSLLAVRLMPEQVEVGGDWNLARRRFHLDRVGDDGVAHLTVDGTFGEPGSHGGTESGSVEYQVAAFAPVSAEVRFQGRQETPTRSSEYDEHVKYTQVSDSLSKATLKGP